MKTPATLLEQFGPREAMEYDVVIVGAGPAGLHPSGANSCTASPCWPLDAVAVRDNPSDKTTIRGWL